LQFRRFEIPDFLIIRESKTQVKDTKEYGKSFSMGDNLEADQPSDSQRLFIINLRINLQSADIIPIIIPYPCSEYMLWNSL
jgi:hypothetical protein